jgi:hypothetical protein
MAVPLIEARRLAIERPVDRVHDRDRDTIGHRQGREPRVVVHEVESAAPLGLKLDLLPRTGDVVRFVQ